MLGVTTNIDFVIDLLNRAEIKDFRYNTNYLESHEFKRMNPPVEILAAYSAIATSASKPGSWCSDGWRIHGSPTSTISAYVDGVRYGVPVESKPTLEVDSYLDDADFWLHHQSFGTWLIKQVDERRVSSDSLSERIVSPMPGMVIAINVSLGDQVKIGDPLVVIEAMKMEHIVRAKRPGRVIKCNVSSGAKVRVGQVLVEVVGDV